MVPERSCFCSLPARDPTFRLVCGFDRLLVRFRVFFFITASLSSLCRSGLPTQVPSSFEGISSNQAHPNRTQECCKNTSDRPARSIIPADCADYSALLRSCGRAQALSDGSRVHDHIIRVGVDNHGFLGSQLVQMYCDCCALEDSLAMFAHLPQRSVFSFNFIAREHICQGLGGKALQLFDQMLQEAVMPNNVTFITALDAYDSHTALKGGKWMHARVMASCFRSDVILGTALVSMYRKCGSVENARKVFDAMPERNVVSWTAMMAVYTKNGHDKEPLYLFDQMQQEGVMPDKVTFAAVLSAFSSEAVLTEGRRMHSLIQNTGLETDVVVGNALLNMYSKCGSLEDVWRMFYKMSRRDVVSWTEMITVCTEYGQAKEALQLFEQMQGEGVMPDKVTFISILAACGKEATLADGRRMHVCIQNKGSASDLVVGTALINMYGKCSSPEDAKRVFEIIPERDLVLWNTLIGVYAQHGKDKDAFRLFEQMQQEDRFKPDEVTFVSLLDGCASQAAFADGKWMHSFVEGTAFDTNIMVRNAIISMYGKCGCVEDARRTFDKMPDRNVISWTAIIGVYAQHGEGMTAIHLFLQMISEVTPDNITFLSVLGACSHAGLVSEGGQIFFFMTWDYGISHTVDHYACMIDLLGRAGRLDEAEYLIDIMPFRPTVETYMALLGACRYLVDVKRGEHSIRQLFELNPESAAPVLLLSSIYTAAGKDEGSANLRRLKDNWSKEATTLDLH